MNILNERCVILLTRKLFVGVVSSIPSIILISLITPMYDAGIFERIIIYSLYIFPIMITYGVFSSYVAEKLSILINKFKDIVSLFIHLTFGVAFILPYSIIEPAVSVAEMGAFNLITMYGLICSLIFFTVDFTFRKFRLA